MTSLFDFILNGRSLRNDRASLVFGLPCDRGSASVREHRSGGSALVPIMPTSMVFAFLRC